MAATSHNENHEGLLVSEFPYYPLYPKDLNGDHKVVVMDNRTYGVYRRLLDLAWHEDPPATLPTDDRVLAVYAKETLEGWLEIKAVVLSCFSERNGRYWQKHLREEWEKLDAKRQRQSESGQRTAAQRWNKPDRPIGKLSVLSSEKPSPLTLFIVLATLMP